MNNNKKKINMSSLKRVFRFLYKSYPKLLVLVVVCIVISSITAAVPAIFQQQVLADIKTFTISGDWTAASKVIIPKVLILVAMYVVSLISITVYTQLMAKITQGFLNKLRVQLFEKM